MPATLLPNGEQQFADGNGVPYAAGTVGMYIPNTLTPKTTWKDSGETLPNTNPIVLDAAGRAIIYGSGQYRQILKDQFGTTVWDQLTTDVLSLVPPAQVLNLPTIAALRADTSGAPAIIVDGYRTVADGGGGIFLLIPDTTTPDNGGTLFVNGVGQRYERSNTNTDMFNILWWGAIRGTAVDNTGAMNSAHATGQVIYYPSGTYTFSTLNPISNGGILGEGDNLTFLSSTDTGTADLLDWVSSSNVPIFRDFSLVAAVNSSNLPVKTGGAGIHFTTTGGSQLVRGFFENVAIVGLPICVDFDAGGLVNFIGCTFALFSQVGAFLKNIVNGDNGGGTFTNCFFNSTEGSCAVWNSGGDLRFTSCVMLGTTGLTIDLQSNTPTSILLIEGCSMEIPGVPGKQNIAFGRTSGTASMGLINITGSEFRSNSAFAIQVGTGGVFYDMAITGNNFLLENGGGAINLLGVAGFTISGNTFRALAGSAVAIITDATCVHGKIGANSYVALNPLVNASTSVFIENVQFQGTAAIATGTAFGALFAGAIAVVFPSPYLVAPTVIANATSTAGGGIAAQAGSITTTGFVLTAIGATNGGAVNCSWLAEGIA